MSSFPPQEPFSRPFAAPSEMFVPEYPQASFSQPFVAAQASPSLNPAQGIALYPRRGVALYRAIICMVAIGVLLGMMVIALLTNGPLSSGDIAPMIFTLIVVLLACLVIGWFGWRLGFQLLLSSKPALVITREGIFVGNILQLRNNCFLSWAEIGQIDASTILFKYLCIRPIPRVPGSGNIGRVSVRGRAPIMIHQSYLDQPVNAIVRQIAALYSTELTQYHVQLRSQRELLSKTI